MTVTFKSFKFDGEKYVEVEEQETLEGVAMKLRNKRVELDELNQRYDQILDVMKEVQEKQKEVSIEFKELKSKLITLAEEIKDEE